MRHNRDMEGGPVTAAASWKARPSKTTKLTRRQAQLARRNGRNHFVFVIARGLGNSGHVLLNCVRLLFIKLKHIGDALLLTPTLRAARAAYPTAEIWVIVRRGTEGILAGCPAIDRLLTAAPVDARQRTAGAWLREVRMALECRRQRFDHAFELGDGDRGRWLASLSGARMRTANVAGVPLHWWWRQWFNCPSRFPWLMSHAVEKDYFTVHDALPLPAAVPPLAFVRERTEAWAAVAGWPDFAVLHPGTRWVRKRWPVERWIGLGRSLQARGLALVISSGPDPEERATASELQRALGPGVVSTDGATSWAQLAGLLYQARLFVGVDTAAMHLAAACQCPTVGIFGPSVQHLWRPWQVPSRVVVAAEARQARQEPDYLARVARVAAEAVPLAEVVTAAEELLAETHGKPN